MIDYIFCRDLLAHIAVFQRQTNSPSGITRDERLAEFALVYSEAGRWKEAEQLQLQVMETRKRVQGEKYLDTVTSMSSLIFTYGNQGQWNKVTKLEMQVMETRKRMLSK